MGWVNPTAQTVSHVASPSSKPMHDEWGGWGSTPAAPVVKDEGGPDPWDFVQAGGPEAPKVAGQNNSSGTNQVIGLISFTNPTSP